MRKALGVELPHRGPFNKEDYAALRRRRKMGRPLRSAKPIANTMATTAAHVLLLRSSTLKPTDTATTSAFGPTPSITNVCDPDSTFFGTVTTSLTAPDAGTDPRPSSMGVECITTV